MSKLFSLLTVATAVLLFTACNNAATESKSPETAAKDSANFDLSTAKAAVEAENVKFVDAFKKGDSAAIAALYSHDALILPPNMESVKRNDIAAFWGGFMKMGVEDFKLITDDVAGNENQLSETGRYEIYGAENKVLDKGKYVVVWKPANGGWKFYRDIFNSDVPAVPAK